MLPSPKTGNITDVDECTLNMAGTFTCDTDAQCVNSYGTYRCECNPGYAGDGKTCRGKNNIYPKIISTLNQCNV